MKKYCTRICDYLLCFRTVEYTFNSVHCNVCILHMQCTRTYDCTSIVCKVLKGYSLPYLIILRNETTFKSLRQVTESLPTCSIYFYWKINITSNFFVNVCNNLILKKTVHKQSASMEISNSDSDDNKQASGNSKKAKSSKDHEKISGKLGWRFFLLDYSRRK